MDRNMITRILALCLCACLLMGGFPTMVLAEGPTITQQPQSVYVAEGEKATITVAAEGDGLTYQWYVAKAGATSFSQSSVTGKTYSIVMSASNDGRQAYCVVTDSSGASVQSKTATLNIKKTVKITSQPVSTTVAEGKQAKATVGATGDGLSYQWYFAAAGSDKFSKASITSATYSVTMDSTRAGRKVYCVVTDKYGNTAQSNTVTLNMQAALQITAQPESKSAYDGETVKTTVSAKGDGLTYTWYVAPAGSTKFSKSSVTSATYSTTMSASSNGRQLYCVITDQYGATVTTNTVTFTMKNKVSITAQPESVTVKEGKQAKATVTATGDGLTYQWYYAAAGSDKFAKASITSATYSVTMDSTRAGRQVYCVVTDKYGNTAQSNTVTLGLATTLSIDEQPASVTSGMKASVSAAVKATGDGLTYQWWVADAASGTFAKSDVTTDTYTLTAESGSAIQKVYCVVTDKYGDSLQSDTVTLCAAYKGYSYTFSGSDVAITGYTGTATQLTVPATIGGYAVTSIAKNAFKDQKNITSIQLDGLSKLETIGEGAFSGCEKLTSVTLPKSVKTIGANAFAQCSAELRVGVYKDSYARTWCKENGIAVKVLDGVMAKITAQPQSVTVQEGKNAAVTVTAEGDGLTYQWWYAAAGSEKFYKSSITTATYSVKMAASNAGRQVYCIVTDEYGNSVQSDTVTLGMQTKLEITAQPVGVTVAEGAMATVRFTAKGDGLTYTWYFKDAKATKFSTTAAFKSNVYSVAMDSTRAGRQLYCVVTDQYGNTVQTDTVTIGMQTKLEITVQPENTAVVEGKKATVSFTVKGDGLTYTWYFKDASATKFSKTTSFTGNTYSVEMTATRAGRQIYCVVADAYGNTVQTNTVTLGMQTKLEITAQPVSVQAAPGETATVKFTAKGDGLTYEWYFKNATASTFSKTTAFKGTTYAVAMDASRHNRQLYCVVTDKYGNTVQTDTVTIRLLTSLKITAQPQSVTVDEGAQATVTFTAEGEGLTYTWYFKDATASKFSKTTSFTSNTYSTVLTAARAGRQIYCIVTDQYGNTAQTATVTLGMRTKLAITEQPVDAQAAPGETATVKFTAKGDGLTYEWYFKNATASTFSKTTAFKGATYAVAMDASRHNRQLYCVVTDKYGNTVTTDTVTIRLLTSLKITAQPESVNVDEGAKATVTFTAEGEGLTYTWYFKDANATKFSKTTSFTSNTYSTVLTAARAGRQIYCIVTDQYGNTVQTDTVTLGMKTKLEITEQPVSVVVAEGEMATIRFTAKGDGLTYTWYFKNAGASKFSTTAAFTSNVYAVAMDSTRDGRELYCVVTDAYGNTVQTDTVAMYMLPKDYTLVIENGGVTITGYTGTATKLTVPATLCGYPVTAIGANCFENNTALTSITLPDTVTSIGSYAFSGCTGLTSMDIPAGVTVISEGMFSNCSNLQKVTMSDQVTRIAYRAFYYCTSLSQMETK